MVCFAKLGARRGRFGLAFHPVGPGTGVPLGCVGRAPTLEKVTLGCVARPPTVARVTPGCAGRAPASPKSHFLVTKKSCFSHFGGLRVLAGCMARGSTSEKRPRGAGANVSSTEITPEAFFVWGGGGVRLSLLQTRQCCLSAGRSSPQKSCTARFL